VIPVHAVLLAAGSSRRLGRAKQLVAVGHPPETLLARAARILASPEIPSIATVRIVLGDPDPAIDAEAAKTGAHLIRSLDPREGSAASIRAAVLDLPASAGRCGILFAVVDQLALSPAHVGALVRAFDGERPVASLYDGTLGVPAIVPSSMREALLSLRGDAGARSLLRERSDTVAVDLPGGEQDVDVPSDLEASG
jgi:molybdenum cofactor cytidylyltransferase